MKKYMILFTALALAGVQTGRADILGLENIKADGSVEVSGQSANNEVDHSPANDHRGGANTRVRIGLSADVTEGVKGHVEASRTSNGGAADASSYGNASRPSSIATEEAQIRFTNAYIDLDNFLGLNLVRLGRQYAGRADDLLVYYGPLSDDALTIRSIDALSVTKKLGPVDLGLATGKVVESQTVGATESAATQGDINVSWITAGYTADLGAAKLPLELGFYQGTNGQASNTTTDNQNLTIIDVRVGANLLADALKLNLEYAVNGGQQNGANTATTPASAGDYKGNALLFGVAFDNADLGFNLHGRYANASGDDPSEANPAAEDDAFHDFSVLGSASSGLRYGEILSESNAFVGPTGYGLDTGANGRGLNIINIGGSYALPFMDKKFNVMADYYMAQVNEVVSGADDGIGSEIDLSVGYKHNDSVHASIGWAMLAVDDGLANGFGTGTTGPDDAINKLFAKLSVSWGNEE